MTTRTAERVQYRQGSTNESVERRLIAAVDLEALRVYRALGRARAEWGEPAVSSDDGWLQLLWESADSWVIFDDVVTWRLALAGEGPPAVGTAARGAAAAAIADAIKPGPARVTAVDARPAGGLVDWLLACPVKGFLADGASPGDRE